ncbi:MAG: tetratricopeptide repeat protein, partial [Planctomycetota bacterium]
QGYYDKAEPLLLKAVEGRRLKLGGTHPHTIESFNNLIDLYQAWNKPEEADKWRAELPRMAAGEQ